MHARTIPETGRAFSAPSGTEDLLEPWSLRRVELKARLLTCLRRHGYALVSTPPFEYADVIERSLPDHRSAEVVRFVEADSGRVVLLRPDITPQVARIASTHLRAHPAPLRLCYQGTVVRRDKRRARRSQQSSQVGVECIGLPGLDGDVEVLRLLGDACRAAGLTHYRVEIGRVDLGRALLAPVPAPWRAQAAAALLRKDHGLLQQVLTESQTTGPEAAALLALLEAYGDAACLTALRQGLPQHRTVQACLDAVEALLDRLQDAHPTATLGVDLGELRGHAYYTSTHFTLFADGPGEPVATGGRYDELLQRFDWPMPACGFALDVGHLAWALQHAGRLQHSATPRVVVQGLWPEHAAVCTELRQAGVQVAELPRGNGAAALDYAQAWGYPAWLSRTSAGELQLHWLRPKSGPPCIASTAAAVAGALCAGPGPG